MDVWKLFRNTLKEVPPVDPKAHLRPLAFFFLLYVILYVAVDNYQFAKNLVGIGNPTSFSFSGKALFHGLLLSVLIVESKILGKQLASKGANPAEKSTSFTLYIFSVFLLSYLFFWFISRPYLLGSVVFEIGNPWLPTLVSTLLFAFLLRSNSSA